MLKNVLKLTALGLLLLCILAVPVFGVSFYESPGVFEENSLFTNLQFGGGTTAYLDFIEDEDGNIVAEDYQKSADIIKERFVAMGYSDVKTSVSDSKVRVEISQKSFLDSVFGDVISLGEWSFVGSDLSSPICDASMVEDAYVTTNNKQGGFSVTIKFNEEGAATFKSRTATNALTGSAIYLMVNDQLFAAAPVSTSVGDTFSFGAWEYPAAAMVSTFIKRGELPAAMEITDTEELAPTVNGGALIAVVAVVAILFVLCCAVLILKGKSFGILAIAVLISDVAILATGIANGSFMLNIATLIVMTLLILLSTALMVYLIAPAAKICAERGFLLPSDYKALYKANWKSLWIHLALFTFSVICWLFARGTFLYIVKALMLFSCADCICYFIFVFFGIDTLNSFAENKKK